MCTFFVRCALLAVLFAGCSRRSGAPADALSAPRTDTVHIALPVIRVTPTGAAGATQIDSATLALLERRVLSRVSSIVRAHAELAAGKPTAGIPPVKDLAPQIRHGLLGTVEFAEDGSISDASSARITAIARLLGNIDGPIEIRATAALGSANIDIAIARARRVYLDLIALNRHLAERDVAITISGAATLHPLPPKVEVLWRAPAAEH